MSAIEVSRHSARTTGQGTSQLGVRVPAQDYNELRRQHIHSGTLFEDPYFPASNESLSLNTKLPFTPVWKRPSEISANPIFYDNGASKFDAIPGMLDDLGFVAAMVLLTQNRILLTQIFPGEHHSFKAGILKVCFYFFGKWVDIVIDDRLPTHNGRLIFAHSNSANNEFWSALLEKAYAKLYGGYGAIEGVTIAEALTDLTGGVVKSFDLEKPDWSLYKLMIQLCQRQSIMCCFIKAERPEDVGVKIDVGLTIGQTYFLTSVGAVEAARGEIFRLVKLRDLSGSQIEWKGAWSDYDLPSWYGVLARIERNYHYQEVKKADGIFWMQYEDFCKYFTDLVLCSYSISKLDEDEDRKNWNSVIINGQWSNDNCSAGGCCTYPTFVKNPQYVVELTEDDDGDGKCSVLVALMQKNRHSQKKLGVQDLSIGFSIYKAPSDDQTVLTKQYVDSNDSIGISGSFTNDGEVNKYFDLDPGRYIIVPCTYKPGEEGDFLLRIVTAAKEPPGGKAYKVFKSIAGYDGRIDAEELEDMFTAIYSKDMGSSTFSIDVCRAMIAMFDKDENVYLDFEEFTNLLKTISTWKSLFSKYDKYRSGKLESVEFSSAINDLGYNVSLKVTRKLFYRFARRRRYVMFDDFVACLCRIKTVNDTFESVKSGDERISGMTKDEFFKVTCGM